MTTITELKHWFDHGKREPMVTHMIVKQDDFDNEDYPHYVYRGEDVRLSAKSGDKTMEIYAMHLDFYSQASEGRSMHYELPEERDTNQLLVKRDWDEDRDRKWVPNESR